MHMQYKDCGLTVGLTEEFLPSVRYSRITENTRNMAPAHSPPQLLSEFPSSFLCLVPLLEVAVLERTEIGRETRFFN